MENIVFQIVSREVTFEESFSSDKFAIIKATVMELEKISEGNNRIYQIEEGEAIAKSLIGKPVYYGTTPIGKHDNPLSKPNSQKEPVGIVEKAKVVGNKIKALIKIFDVGIMETLKRGAKYLFSVGGNAISETIKKIGDKIVHVLSGAKCNHLQIVDMGTPVGFPDAKMEELVEIQETVMICENGVCEGVCNLPEQKPEPCELVFRVTDSCNIIFEDEDEKAKQSIKPKFEGELIQRDNKYYLKLRNRNSEEEDEDV